jgi:hypothetical protein
LPRKADPSKRLLILPLLKLSKRLTMLRRKLQPKRMLKISTRNLFPNFQRQNLLNMMQKFKICKKRQIYIRMMDRNFREFRQRDF